MVSRVELKDGHSFASYGPILEVGAIGKLPGLDRIEVVANGEVLHTIAPGKVRVKMDRPGWLAVRCFEPVGVTVRYALTTPF